MTKAELTSQLENIKTTLEIMEEMYLEDITTSSYYNTRKRAFYKLESIWELMVQANMITAKTSSENWDKYYDIMTREGE